MNRTTIYLSAFFIVVALFSLISCSDDNSRYIEGIVSQERKLVQQTRENMIDKIATRKRKLKIKFTDNVDWRNKVFEFKKVKNQLLTWDVDVIIDGIYLKRVVDGESKLDARDKEIKLTYLYTDEDDTVHQLTMYVIDDGNNSEKIRFFYYIEHVDHYHTHTSTGGGGRD